MEKDKLILPTINTSRKFPMFEPISLTNLNLNDMNNDKSSQRNSDGGTGLTEKEGGCLTYRHSTNNQQVSNRNTNNNGIITLNKRQSRAPLQDF